MVVRKKKTGKVKVKAAARNTARSGPASSRRKDPAKSKQTVPAVEVFPEPMAPKKKPSASSETEHYTLPPERTRAYDADTAIKLYLREIGQVRLLTPEEEIELAARIKKGDKRAREQMIKANLRLVVKIAHDYEGFGLPLLDLISEGNIGLMKAVERFDPSKGGKLSTYGSWWIKQSIKRALANQSKTIRLPVHLVDKISKMRRIAMRLQEEFGREPTDEELAEELGMTSTRVAADADGGNSPGLARCAHRRRRLEQLLRNRPGRKRRNALRAARGQNCHEHAAGNGHDPRPSRSHHSAVSIRSGRRDGEDPRGSGREIWRDARAGAADSEHCAQQAPQNDRKTRSRSKVTLSRLMHPTAPTTAEIQDGIRNVPDFPQPGIQFKDITPVLADPRLFAGSIDLLAGDFQPGQVDAVVGIDARGFIFAAGVALKLEAGFVPVRKQGKLPYQTFEQSYALEYGENTIAIHVDAFKPGSRVLLIDDLLATGGTARAAAQLVEKAGGKILGVNFLIELAFLQGREKLKAYPLRSLVVF